MQGLSTKGIQPDYILKDYDLILIPEWVLAEVNDAPGRSQYKISEQTTLGLSVNTDFLLPTAHVKRLSFYGACHDALDNVFLAEQIKDNNRNDGKDKSSHHRPHIHGSIPAFKILDRHRDRLIFALIQH